MPSFDTGSGPFAGRTSELPDTVSHGNALATLYLALMIDYELDLLGASGDVLFGSSSHKNPLLCSLLAQLRSGDQVLMSGDEASTVLGAWYLTQWQSAGERDTEFKRAVPAGIPGLKSYRNQWRQLAEKN